MKRLITYLILLLPCALAAEEPDTAVHALREVVVRAARVPSASVSEQRLAGEELKRLNSQSVADALRYFAGVQVKDYGGVGGLKTVNVRSMGTNHTGVVYDGVELGNAQNGQIDLGQFSLDNVEAISLYNGSKSGLLQPARDFGTAASVYIRTRTPQFAPGSRWHLRAQLRGGSFDLINPSALFELKLSESVAASLSAEWMRSSGKYRFRYRRTTASGATAYDTTATRQNGDVDAIRAELNLVGSMPGGEWRMKAYHYNSERGIPGAIVNNVWRRGERVWDNNTFAQASFTKSIGRFTTLANAKYSHYRTHYVNNDRKQIKIDNRYRQNEAYISTANEYAIMPQWRVSLSYDFQWNGLDTDLPGFEHPDRFTHMLAGATALTLPRFKAQASAMGTFIDDRRHGHSPLHRRAFSPSLYLSGRPLRNHALWLRAFVKRSFRMPTFNDLYYTDAGNAALKPERVTQYDFGAAFEHSSGGFVSVVRVSADAYINRVDNKIVAYPKGQQFRWTMLNLGEVDIKGIDISALITLCPARDLAVTLRGQYTFQRAIDITNPSDSYYRHQIPYIPKHSGSAVLNASWRQWALNASFIYVGERYNQQENISYNHMRPWHTTDLSLSRDFTFGKVNFRALAEVNNVFARDYDVILNYPMPKRNYRLTLTVDI